MSARLETVGNKRDGLATSGIWTAIALSLLIHIVLLWGMPRIRLPTLDKLQWGDAQRMLSVNLAPLNVPAAATPPPASQTPPSRQLTRPPAAVRTPPVSPAPADDFFTRDVPSSPQSTLSMTAPSPAREFVGGDLSSYIEARRRARNDSTLVPTPGGESQARLVEDDKTRGDRIVAANLGTQRAPTFGYDPARKGGAFQLQRMGSSDAEFIFYGWSKEHRRNMAQLIVVQTGGNVDIRLAVVHRIIAIIRDFEQGDFLWESARQGHSLTLSARPRDNAALERFMMIEFFNEAPVPR